MSMRPPRFGYETQELSLEWVHTLESLDRLVDRDQLNGVDRHHQPEGIILSSPRTAEERRSVRPTR